MDLNYIELICYVIKMKRVNEIYMNLLNNLITDIGIESSNKLI